MCQYIKFNDAGEAFEPFNLKNERETGHFDENLNYVFKKEKGEIDAWVAQMDEVSMERAIGEAAFAMKVQISFILLNFLLVCSLKPIEKGNAA